MTIFLLSTIETYAQFYVEIDAGADTTLCAAGSVRLRGKLDPLIYKYEWTSSANPAYSETTTKTPIVNVSATTTFYLSGTCIKPQNNFINGNFETFNIVPDPILGWGFTSDYGYVPPTAGALGPEGVYTILTRAGDCHEAFTMAYDHTLGTSSGHYLAINGATAPAVVWSQEKSGIPPNTDFIFYAWVMNVEKNVTASAVPRLRFTVNGAPLGIIYAPLPVSGEWTQFYAEWNSGSNTTVTIAIYDNTVAAMGNDFALDDICFSEIITLRDTVTVYVTPPITVYDTVRICQGDTCKFGTQTITQTGDYSEVFRTAAGCDSTVNCRVVVSNPTIKATIVDDSCSVAAKSSIVLDFSDGMAPYSCIWNDGATQFSRDNLDTGTYTATVSDAINCVAAYSTTFVKNNLAVSYTVVPAVCYFSSGSFTLSITGGFAPYSINWGNIADHNDSIAYKLSSGEYAISVANGQCVRSLSIPVPFIPPPVACFTPTYDTHNKDVPVLFADCSKGTTSWHWNFGDGDDATDPNPQHLYDDFGSYTVTLIVSNDSSCVDSISHVITITDLASCYIPNSFTPNNDGVNDSFCPICNNIQLYDYSFIIYDRWGNIVFESHTVNEAWDGLINGKRRASQELFRWVFSYRNESNVPQTRTGYVTLIR